MPAAGAGADDIIGDHPLYYMEPGKQLLQRLGIADAVLEADDADTRPRVTGNLLCRPLRPRALHGNEDDVRILQRRRLGREIDEVGREADVPAVLVAERSEEHTSELQSLMRI